VSSWSVEFCRKYDDGAEELFFLHLRLLLLDIVARLDSFDPLQGQVVG